MTEPLALHAEPVRPEWVDYNGHMHEAYYVLVFGNATDAFYDHIGMDAAYRERSRTSLYTLEAHVNFLDEVGEGAPLAIATQLLGVDDKRLHLFHTMRRGDDGRLIATYELMALHVDMAGPRAAPFAAAIMARLRDIEAQHAGLPAPEQAGRSIGLRAKHHDSELQKVRIFNAE